MAVNRVFILAGEPSGDVLGAELVRALRAQHTGIAIDAWGGPELSKALGKPVRRGLEHLAFMGFGDVVANAGAVLGNLRAAKAVLAEPWDLVVLIDYPGFNLRMATWMRSQPWRSSRKVVQLVAPSVWAWKEGRVRILREAYDAVLPLLPFEPDFLAERGVHAPYFGHPALDRFAGAVRSPRENVLVLAPGSRETELRRLAPVFAETAELLGMEPLWIRPSSWTEGDYRALLRKVLQAEPRGGIAEGMAHAQGAEVALVASGTATLELGILGVPMVVAYRVDALSYRLAKQWVKVPFVSLVNLVLGREAVAERLQKACTAKQLASDLNRVRREGPERSQQLHDLAEFRAQLGEPGAMQRTASYLLAL
ncbi:MAG: hypothetical protein RLZZ261_1426 [Bacteroidota bacterium]|jgi:lipid-A-disaccharide synthase